MTLRQFTIRLYLFSFLQWFAPIWAVEKLFMQSRGVSINQIAAIVAIWMVAMFFLEVPTGVLADRYSRRKILVIAAVLCGLYFVGDLFSHTAGAFLFSWLIYAPSMALTSGTLESYVYDVLADHNLEEEFAQVWGRSRAAQSIGMGIAMAIGGWLASHSFESTLLVSIAAMVLLTGSAVLLPEAKPRHHVHEETHWQSIQEGFKSVWSNSSLRLAFWYSLFIVSAITTLDEYWDLYLQGIGVAYFWIGLTSTIVAALVALASLFSHRLKASHLPIIIAGSVLLGVALALVHSPWVAVAAVPLMIGMNAGNLVTENLIQHVAEDHRRATVASICNLGNQLSIVLVILFAFLADRGSIQAGMWTVVGSLSLFLLVVAIERGAANRSALFAGA